MIGIARFHIRRHRRRDHWQRSRQDQGGKRCRLRSVDRRQYLPLLRRHLRHAGSLGGVSVAHLQLQGLGEEACCSGVRR